MNLLKNSVQLIGNLGKNPEITKLENGKRIARVTLATNEAYGEKSKRKVKKSPSKEDLHIAVMKPKMAKRNILPKSS